MAVQPRAAQRSNTSVESAAIRTSVQCGTGLGGRGPSRRAGAGPAISRSILRGRRVEGEAGGNDPEDASCHWPAHGPRRLFAVVTNGQYDDDQKDDAEDRGGDVKETQDALEAAV